MELTSHKAPSGKESSLNGTHLPSTNSSSGQPVEGGILTILPSGNLTGRDSISDINISSSNIKQYIIKQNIVTNKNFVKIHRMLKLYYQLKTILHEIIIEKEK